MDRFCILTLLISAFQIITLSQNCHGYPELRLYQHDLQTDLRLRKRNSKSTENIPVIAELKDVEKDDLNSTESQDPSLGNKTAEYQHGIPKSDFSKKHGPFLKSQAFKSSTTKTKHNPERITRNLKHKKSKSSPKAHLKNLLRKKLRNQKNSDNPEISILNQIQQDSFIDACLHDYQNTQSSKIHHTLQHQNDELNRIPITAQGLTYFIRNEPKDILSLSELQDSMEIINSPTSFNKEKLKFLTNLESIERIRDRLLNTKEKLQKQIHLRLPKEKIDSQLFVNDQAKSLQTEILYEMGLKHALEHQRDELNRIPITTQGLTYFIRNGPKDILSLPELEDSIEIINSPTSFTEEKIKFLPNLESIKIDPLDRIPITAQGFTNLISNGPKDILSLSELENSMEIINNPTSFNKEKLKFLPNLESIKRIRDRLFRANKMLQKQKILRLLKEKIDSQSSVNDQAKSLQTEILYEMGLKHALEHQRDELNRIPITAQGLTYFIRNEPKDILSLPKLEDSIEIINSPTSFTEEKFTFVPNLESIKIDELNTIPITEQGFTDLISNGPKDILSLSELENSMEIINSHTPFNKEKLKFLPNLESIERIRDRLLNTKEKLQKQIHLLLPKEKIDSQLFVNDHEKFLSKDLLPEVILNHAFENQRDELNRIPITAQGLTYFIRNGPKDIFSLPELEDSREIINSPTSFTEEKFKFVPNLESIKIDESNTIPITEQGFTDLISNGPKDILSLSELENSMEIINSHTPINKEKFKFLPNLESIKRIGDRLLSANEKLQKQKILRLLKEKIDSESSVNDQAKSFLTEILYEVGLKQALEHQHDELNRIPITAQGLTDMISNGPKDISSLSELEDSMEVINSHTPFNKEKLKFLLNLESIKKIRDRLLSANEKLQKQKILRLLIEKIDSQLSVNDQAKCLPKDVLPEVMLNHALEDATLQHQIDEFDIKPLNLFLTYLKSESSKQPVSIRTSEDSLTDLLMDWYKSHSKSLSDTHGSDKDCQTQPQTQIFAFVPDTHNEIRSKAVEPQFDYIPPIPFDRMSLSNFEINSAEPDLKIDPKASTYLNYLLSMIKPMLSSEKNFVSMLNQLVDEVQNVFLTVLKQPDIKKDIKHKKVFEDDQIQDQENTFTENSNPQHSQPQHSTKESKKYLKLQSKLNNPLKTLLKQKKSNKKTDKKRKDDLDLLIKDKFNPTQSKPTSIESSKDEQTVQLPTSDNSSKKKPFSRIKEFKGNKETSEKDNLKHREPAEDSHNRDKYQSEYESTKGIINEDNNNMQPKKKT